MSKSPAILTYAQIFNPGDKYLKPTLTANRVIYVKNYEAQSCYICYIAWDF